MSPRRSVAAALQTRSDIVERAMLVASVEGLDGFSLGRLADDLQMSKSGVLGHFRTKEALQLDALEAAIEVFRREVWEPSLRAEPGLARLQAICDAWISYLQRGVFPGGCFLTAASCEFDGRPGPVHDAIRRALSGWHRVLGSQVRLAIDAGELPADADPEMIAFQLNALAMGANQAIQLFEDPRAVRLAHRAMRAVVASHGVSARSPGQKLTSPT
ncbi:MAG TPA: TetR/AcrR family transcriptional regulator [Solirubrobacteraceae bacterium]